MPVNAASRSIGLADELADKHSVGFFVHSRLVGHDLEPLQRHLPDHLRHLEELHGRGVIVFAGPFFTETGENTGNGFYVVRSDDIEAARRIAGDDPLHRAGVRTFTVEPWLQAFA